MINQLPKVDLQMASLFEKLFNHALNLSKLRVFGCQYFSWLRPYSTHKLITRYNPCVFLGYSPTQSAYPLIARPTNTTHLAMLNMLNIYFIFPSPHL